MVEGRVSLEGGAKNLPIGDSNSRRPKGRLAEERLRRGSGVHEILMESFVR